MSEPGGRSNGEVFFVLGGFLRECAERRVEDRGRLRVKMEVIGRANSIGFQVVGEYRGPVVHDDGIMEGYVLTFRRDKMKTGRGGQSRLGSKAPCW